MSEGYVSLVVEGSLDETISKKLISKYANHIKIRTTYSMGSRSEIRKRINKYNQAARVYPFWVLVDLNQDECPPILIKEWVPHKNPQLFLRVAVRQVEAWLLADRQAFARFLGVGLNHPSKS